MDRTCLGKCSVFYINKNGSHGGHFTSGIKIQTCSPNNSHPGLQKTPKGGVILETCGRDLGLRVLGTNDVDEAVNNLETLIHRHMDKCMPFRTVRISSRRDPAWVTPLLKSLMRSKSRIGQNRGCRLRENSRRISEVIDENRRNLLQAPVGDREWWKHVDNLSQRRRSSTKVTLYIQSQAELND